MNTEQQKEIAINEFIQNQSLGTYQKMLNVGVSLKHIVNNEWKRLTIYKFPFIDKKLIRLYDDNFNVNGLGVYNSKN